MILWFSNIDLLPSTTIAWAQETTYANSGLNFSSILFCCRLTCGMKDSTHWAKNGILLVEKDVLLAVQEINTGTLSEKAMCLTYQQRIMAPLFTSAQVFIFSIPTRSNNVLPKQTVKCGKAVGRRKKKIRQYLYIKKPVKSSLHLWFNPIVSSHQVFTKFCALKLIEYSMQWIPLEMFDYFQVLPEIRQQQHCATVY